MKKLIILTGIVLSAQWAIGQRLSDPTYAAGNYKHPNKAAYARLHNLDKQISLTSARVSRSDNYKQPMNKTLSLTAVVPANPVTKSTVSYKHPQGL